MSLAIGDTIDDKYRIVRLLGEGGMGAVYEGENLRIHRRVAIKILEKHKIVDIADVERVSRELHILKLIRHPHIIQLYEVFLT